MTIENLKSFLKNIAKSFYHQLIIKSYPIYKQINLTNNIEAGLEEMKSFIAAKIDEEHALETAIDALENTDLEDSFQVGSDEDMKAFVASKMPTLTTDDQKLCIITGVQGCNNA